MKSKRIESIDLLRGIVMVLMALDHVRDYFHLGVFAGINNPTDLETTTPFLFFTRFITHYCAPIFILLAGTSAYLYGQNKSKSDLSKFLLSRGVWLMFVEIAILNFCWWFDYSFDYIQLQVIWVIGLAMVLISFTVFLPKKVILTFGLLLVFGHNLLDGIQVEGNGIIAFLWHVLHDSGGVQLPTGNFLNVLYPVIPWFGLMLLGYSLGNFYSKEFEASKRKKYLRIFGISAILLFIVIRGYNQYGDPKPWEYQATTVKTLLSFLNVHKYPPSLAYLLITMGPALIVLSFLENVKTKVSSFLLVFGKVPFFYYVIHVALIHFMALIGLAITGKDWKMMLLSMETFQSGVLSENGYALWVVYLVWVFVVLLLYPISRKYMHYKKENSHKWWLKYL